MAIRVNLDPIRRLQEFLRYIDGHYEVQAEGVTGPSALKLSLLQATGRPFLDITPAMKNAVLAEWKRNLTKVATKNLNALNIDAAFESMAQTIKAVVLRRFTEQGVDVMLKPLSAPYLDFKRRHGLDTRIGIATGVLFRNLQRTRFVMRKKS